MDRRNEGSRSSTDEEATLGKRGEKRWMRGQRKDKKARIRKI